MKGFSTITQLFAENLLRSKKPIYGKTFFKKKQKPSEKEKKNFQNFDFQGSDLSISWWESLPRATDHEFGVPDHD